MPKTRAQSSRSQNKRPVSRLKDNKNSKGKHTSKLDGRSRTRSGRAYRSGDGGDLGATERPHRSRSRSKKLSARKEYTEQLQTRIASIPIKDRPIPDTDNLKVLGVELKLRLAATSDIITEHGRRGGKVQVSTATGQNRFVPLWDINKQQDPRLLCEVKVKVNAVRRRRFK